MSTSVIQIQSMFTSTYNRELRNIELRECYNPVRLTYQLTKWFTLNRVNRRNSALPNWTVKDTTNVN